MSMAGLTRRRVLQTAAAVGATVPFAGTAMAAGGVTPKGRMVLAWHTNIAPRWLDPGQHDGSATPDNFLHVVHDALIKNYKQKLYDHLALAEHFEFAEDARSATFRLRPNLSFHDGSPVTPDDVKWSYENYHGAWAQVLHERTDRITLVDKRTIRFDFKAPFLDFARLLGTSNVCGAGWVVPAKYVEKVGKDGFVAKPVGAGPYKLVNQEPGTRLDFEAFDGYYAPVHIKEFTILSAPDAATRVAMVERGEADITYGLSGELVRRIQRSQKVMLAPVLSGNWWLKFPGFQDPNNPFHDKRVRQAVSLAIDRGDQRRGMRWPRHDRRQLDQRRRRVRARLAGMGAQYRKSPEADGGGRPPERLYVRLADPGAAVFFARRAHADAAAGDRHSRQAADPGARGLQQASAGRDAGMAGAQRALRGRPDRGELGQLV